MRMCLFHSLLVIRRQDKLVLGSYIKNHQVINLMEK